MEAVRTSETSVDNHFTRQYIPEDDFERHTRRRENLISHTSFEMFCLRKTPTDRRRRPVVRGVHFDKQGIEEPNLPGSSKLNIRLY
jgi:hypothetical protein